MGRVAVKRRFLLRFGIPFRSWHGQGPCQGAQVSRQESVRAPDTADALGGGATGAGAFDPSAGAGGAAGAAAAGAGAGGGRSDTSGGSVSIMPLSYPFGSGRARPWLASQNRGGL